MYRRANLTGVNPLVYYLEEEGCAWDVGRKGDGQRICPAHRRRRLPCPLPPPPPPLFDGDIRSRYLFLLRLTPCDYPSLRSVCSIVHPPSVRASLLYTRTRVPREESNTKVPDGIQDSLTILIFFRYLGL